MSYVTIACGGQLLSSKDTVSDYLATRLNELCLTPWKRNAFANKVKEVFEQSFGKDREWIEKWKRLDMVPPGFKKNVRQCLIGIGDGFRQMNNNIWIERAFENQESHQIISDCRYINECNYIREKGGITILLWRDGYMNNMQSPSEQEFMPFIRKCLDTQSCSTGEDRWKPFEGEVGPGLEIPFDFFIRNEGGLDDLYRKVDNLLIPFIRKKYGHLFKS